MPYKNKADKNANARAYYKRRGKVVKHAWYQKNKAKQLASNKVYYQKNKAEILVKQNAYYELNKAAIIANNKAYSQTPQGKKVQRIQKWKMRGVICDDFDTLYELYLKEEFCWLCNIKFEGKGNNRKCLDHNHNTGEFRYICCSRCNRMIG